MRNFFVKSISNSYHLSNLPQMKNMLFRCEHMISKSVLHIGIFRNFVKLHRCTLILLLLTKPLINRIFLSPLHFWTKISCNQLFPNKLHNGSFPIFDFGCRSDLTENETFFRKLLRIRNDQNWYTKLFWLHKVFPKPTICLI